MDAAPSSQQHYRLSALPLPISVTSLLSVATPARPSDMSLTALYDSVVFDWLSPLAEQVPTKVRIFKERMIRSLVTEILFSRISLVPVRIDEEKIVNVEGMDSNDIDSTVGSQQGTGESIPLQEILLTSQDINSTSALTSPHELSESAFRVLRRYTTVHSQVPPNKRVLTTISHWEPGTDPSNYNWDKTVRELKGKQSQSDQQSAARRRQRREERKRRQSGIIEAQVLSQPSTPRVAESVRMWGSQPDRVSGATSSVEPGIWSSQAVEEEIPLTQVERGVFGGREASRKTVVKERKKRRAAGF